MPTITEIRQKYPQYQDMSDNDLASALHKKFYSDMPVDQFNSKIGLSSQESQQSQDLRGELSSLTQGASPEAWQRATLLPFEKNTETGDARLAMPGLVKGLLDSGAQAFTSPGRALSGELQVMGPDGNVTPEAIAEGLNFAGWASPSSPASGLARPTPKVATPRQLTPGQDAALAAERLGVDLPRAAASDSISIQQTGKTLTNVPIAGTPLRKASENAINQLDEAALRIQRGYGAGDIPNAGALVRQGVKDYSSNTLDDLVSQKYDVVDKLVKPDVATPLNATKARVGSLLASREKAALPGEGSAAAIVKQAVDRPEGLTYEGVKRLRTEVGQMLKNPQMAPAGTSQDELKALYGSLSDDLRSVVQKAGGEKAVKAFEEANTFAARTIQEQKALDKIIGPQSDEGLFSSIQAMAGTNARANLQSLMRVRRAVSPETWNEISSAVISNMGRAADGTFSPDRFLTSYGKLSDNGKALLFRGNGNKELASALDDIATVSTRFKQLNQFSNPSGTGQAIIGGSYLPALYMEPTTLVASIATGRGLANVLAKPTSAKKLAEWAKAYEKVALEPTKANQNMLGVRAKVLALAVANDAGNPGLFNQLVSPLSIPQKVKAGPENSPLLMELEQQGQPNNPRMLAPNET